MKEFLLKLCLFFALSSAFCVGGEVFHHKNLSVLKTKYFDFIFCDETFDDAKKIAFVADSYYLEITKKFGTEPYQRFPVSITRSLESLNGFFTPFPYNMIVLYLAEPGSAEMESYSDTVLSVFYHELTHAVTLNLKSPLFRKLSRIFGDFATPAAFSMPYFWIEGAAVFNESSTEKKDGRLKNPFFTELLIQAKLNDAAGVKKFPSWRDVAGARDTPPGGSDRYVFGACFAEFLVEKYGMEKYSELWKNAGEATFLSFAAGVFEKTYGTKIDDEWKEFKDSIKIPDFFTKNENSARLLSRKNAEIRAFDVFIDEKSGGKKIAFYDSVTHAVFLLESGENAFKKPKKLFSALGVTELYFSDDGKNLLVTRLTAKETVKIQKGVFNLKSKKYKIIKNPDDEIFANARKNIAAEKNGLNWEIALKLPDSSEKKYSPGEKIVLTNPHLAKFDEKNIFVSFSWAFFSGENSELFSGALPKCGVLKIDLESGNGDFYLQKNAAFAGKTLHGVNYAALFDVSGEKTKFAAVFEDYESKALYEIELPTLDDENAWQKIAAVRTEKSSESLGTLQNAESGKNENEVNLSEISSRDSETFGFENETPASDSAASVPKTLSLRNSGSEESLNQKESSGSNKNPDTNEFSDTNAIPDSNPENLKIEKYSSLPYLFKGTKLPLGFVPVKNSDFETESTGILGVTYMTTNPYLDDFIMISAGYDPDFKDGGVSLSYSGSDSSKKIVFETAAVFDKKIFKQANGSIDFSKVFWRGLASSFSGGISLDAIYGRESEADALITAESEEKTETFDGSYWKNGFFGQSKIYLGFSNLRQTGKNVHCISGFSFVPFLDFEKKNYKIEFKKDGESKVYKTDYETEEKYLNAGASAILRIPFVAPLSFQASIFPSSSYFLYGAARANLFTYEIQKGIPAISLYAARFDLSLSYSGKISYSHGDFFDIAKVCEIASDVKKEDYSDCVSLGAFFTLSPNTGYMAAPAVQFQLGASFSFRPNPKDGESRTEFGVFGNLEL